MSKRRLPAGVFRFPRFALRGIRSGILVADNIEFLTAVLFAKYLQRTLGRKMGR
jgi:hypothetical protein